jgi:hypothetical protein
MVAGLIAACAGWYWFVFWSPAGLPVQADAYRDAENGFALVAPEGWQATGTKECKNVGTLLSTATACVVLNVHRDTSPPGSGPGIQVTTVPIGAVVKTGWGGSARVTEAGSADLAKVLHDSMGKALPGYAGENHAVVAVDRIPSLRLMGSATFSGTIATIGDKVVTIPDFSATQTEHHVATGAVLVPGGTRAFLIAYVSDAADRAEVGAAFDAAVSSFRLTDGRPTPFQSSGGLMGSMKGDFILGGLVGLSLGLLKMIAGSR